MIKVRAAAAEEAKNAAHQARNETKTWQQMQFKEDIDKLQRKVDKLQYENDGLKVIAEGHQRIILQERMKTALTRLVVYKRGVMAGADVELRHSATPLTAVQALQKSNIKSNAESAAYRSGQNSLRKSGESPGKNTATSIARSIA